MAGQSRMRRRSSDYAPAETETGRDASSIHLDGLLKAVWRRKLVFLFPIVLFIAAGVYYTMHAPKSYESAATLVVKNEGVPLDQTEADLRREDEFLATQAEVISSHAVISRAVDALELPPPEDPALNNITLIKESLTVSPVKDTDVLEVSLWHAEPKEAQRILEAILVSYRDFLKQDDQTGYVKTLNVLTTSEKELREQLSQKNSELISAREESPLFGPETNPAGVQQELLTKLGSAIVDAKNRRIQLENQVLAFQENQPQVVEELLRLTKTENPEEEEQVDDPVGIQVTILVDLGEAMIDAKNRRIELENQIESFKLAEQDSAKGKITPSAVASLQAAGGRSRNAITESFAANPVVTGGVKQRSEDNRSNLVNSEELAEVRLALFEAISREKEVAEKYGEKHPLRQAARESVLSWEARLSETTDHALSNLQEDYGIVLAHLEKELAAVRRHEELLTKAYQEDFQKAKVAVLDHIRKEALAVSKQEARLIEAYEKDFASAKEVDASLMKETAIRDEILRLRTMHDSIMAQLSQWQMTTNTIADGQSEIKVTVLEPPMVAETPAWPVGWIVLGVCGLLGSFAGLGLVTVAERNDRRVRSLDEVRGRLPFPIISEVPPVSSRDAVKRGRLVHDKPAAVFTETFRNLRTLLENGFVQERGQVIQLASPAHGEGKTTVTANLAFSFAQLGRKVAVIDADLRKGTLHKIFDVSNDVGLTSTLRGEQPLETTLRTSPLAAIDVLPKGPAVDNPAELLARPEFSELLASLRQVYDVVLIDTPALLEVADGLVVVPQADQVLVSAVMGTSSESEIEQASDLLESLGAHVAGMVVNGVAASSRRNGHYRPPMPRRPVSDGPAPKKTNGAAHPMEESIPVV